MSPVYSSFLMRSLGLHLALFIVFAAATLLTEKETPPTVSFELWDGPVPGRSAMPSAPRAAKVTPETKEPKVTPVEARPNVAKPINRPVKPTQTTTQSNQADIQVAPAATPKKRAANPSPEPSSEVQERPKPKKIEPAKPVRTEKTAAKSNDLPDELDDLLSQIPTDLPKKTAPTKSVANGTSSNQSNQARAGGASSVAINDFKSEAQRRVFLNMHLPENVSGQAKASVRVTFYAGVGPARVRKIEFVKKSEDERYNQAALDAVERTDFPPIPEGVASNDLTLLIQFRL